MDEKDGMVTLHDSVRPDEGLTATPLRRKLPEGWAEACKELAKLAQKLGLPSASIHGSSTQFTTALKHTVRPEEGLTATPLRRKLPEGWAEAYKEPAKLAQKLGQHVKAKVREALPTTIKNFTLTSKTAIVSGCVNVAAAPTIQADVPYVRPGEKRSPTSARFGNRQR
ncbi:unnamed protein product [Zymoseptoria tritici ST99CH_3D1]|nr:unnamed protein product [Zymoseptoria tritici ST99CH_3D1]